MIDPFSEFKDSIAELINKYFIPCCIGAIVSLSTCYFGETPMLLTWLIFFVSLFIAYLLQRFINFLSRKIEENQVRKAKYFKQREEQEQYQEMIEIGITAMDKKAKKLALEILMNTESAPSNKYKRIVYENQDYGLSNFYCYGQPNPFIVHVPYEERSYWTIMGIEKQEGYYIVSFCDMFYNYLLDNKDNILK